MPINGAETNRPEQRGHVLLLAGAEAVHRRRPQVSPSANLAALSTVPSPVLLDSMVAADVVHLDGPRDQNTVLLRLRAAAATPGPLLLYLSGRLMTDRKQHQFHLALPGTTSASVRYTGLPWSWLRNELRARPAGTAAVFVDLAADNDAWTRLRADPGALAEGLQMFGAVVPPGFGAVNGASAYTRHLIEQLRRSPARPSNSHLHAATAATAPLPPGSVIFPATQILPAPAPGAGFAGQGHDSGPYSRPAPGVERGVRPQHQHGPVEQHPVRSAHPAPTPIPIAVVPPPSPRTAPLVTTAPPPPAAAVRLPSRPVPAQPTAPGPPAPVPAPQPVQPDPRPHLWQLAQSGQHRQAADLAAAWEQHTMRTYGPNSTEATQWAEIRADLARIADNYPLATTLWIAACRTRLGHQAPDAPEVLTAAQGAHWCWERVTNTAAARELGPELIALLRQLPALDARHIPAAQRRLESLRTTPQP